MSSHLKFSHKILLAASLVVIATFALFTLYNDYLQRSAIRANLEATWGNGRGYRPQHSELAVRPYPAGGKRCADHRPG